jgi:hypothetical protein
MKLEKIFICDHGKDQIVMKMLLGEHAKSLGIKVEVEWTNEKQVRNIPEGYDIYLLHLEDIEYSNDILKLKRKQPWSYIIGFSGAVDYDTTYDRRTDFDDKKDSCDKILWALHLTEEIKQVLEERSKAC